MSITFKRHQLANGLKLLIHQDLSTPLVSCNLVYKVGSRDEDPDFTGMAHLFEHFMFCGSKNVPHYDLPLQKIGAINNAYTSQDITHYYITLPANNLETALWLESDRMMELAFDEKQLQTQKQVVMEEFKENYLNRPFGDMWLNFNKMVYKTHPYNWVPIGKELAHIEKMDMELMKKFFYRFYRPNNAILVLSGNLQEDAAVRLTEKWFADIPSGEPLLKMYPIEPPQTVVRNKVITGDFPHDLILKGWKMCDRFDADFYAYDLLSDLLGSGNSSYLYEKLVTQDSLFTNISCNISATIDAGYWVMMAIPADDINPEIALEKLNDFIYHFDFKDSLNHNLQKVKNKVESILLNNEIKIEDRSSQLAVTEAFSCAEDFINEKERYFAVTEEQIRSITKSFFKEESSNNLIYKKTKD